MRILITGITGLLGWSLDKTCPNGIKTFGTYYPPKVLPLKMHATVKAVDIRDYAQMEAIFNDIKPDLVIHTAAIGSVDFTEKNKEETKAVNLVGTQIVVDLCNKHNAGIMYISSNAVYDGNNPFYSEDSQINPINYYGKLKVEAEAIVQSSTVPWVIVRPILMYGWNYPGERDNPVTLWVRSLRENKSLKVVDNVYSKPLYSISCAKTIWSVVNKNKQGIFNIAGADHLSLYEFARITAEEFGLDQRLITPVPDSYFPEIAPRPKDTSFSTSKMEMELELLPLPVRLGLREMKANEDILRLGDNVESRSK